MSLTRNVPHACYVVRVGVLELETEQKSTNTIHRLKGFTVLWERQAMSNYIIVSC